MPARDGEGKDRGSLLGRRAEARALDDFDRLVMPIRIAAPAGYPDVAAFGDALAKHAREHPTFDPDPVAKATEFGGRTGDLLAVEKGPVAARDDDGPISTLPNHSSRFLHAAMED